MIRGDYWWVYCRDDGVDWWHRVRGVSEPLAKGSCTEIAEIPAPDDAEFVLCIPGDKVRMHRVRVPARNRRKVLANLNFALEDKLLHDTEQYHLVPVPESGQADEISVAVIAKSYLDELLDSFTSRQWKLRFLAPDYFFIKTPDEDSWLLDVSTEPFLVCMPDSHSGSIIAGELDSQAPGTLLLALESAAVPPRKLFVRVCDDNQANQLATWQIEVNGQDIELQLVNDQLARHDWLAGTDLPDSGHNLLTGDYAVRDSNISKLRRYVPLTGLAAALIILLVTDWVVAGIRLESEFNRLQTDINETYLGLFPDARNLTDPRYQMEQALMEARSFTGIDAESGFLASLELIAGVIGSMDNQLQKLQFDDTGLILEVSVPDYESLEELQSRLARELPSKLENAELKQGRVYARLVLGDSV